MAMDAVTWMGIGFCLTQSAMFSGLNLAVFGVSRLRLEVEHASGNPAAGRVLELRRDSNFLLTTILWGNVGINVLLTLLSNSVLAGVAAFIFSTVVITFVGEILPQAYFSRNALRMADLLSPVLRFYQVVLYLVAKPSAKVLDWWLGPEGMQYFREEDLRQVIKKHIEADEAEIDRLEGIGALNFLAIDDLVVAQEGEPVAEGSIVSLPVEDGKPVFPAYAAFPSDPFLTRVQASGKKWVIITDLHEEPSFVLDADGFLRESLFNPSVVNPLLFCHRPIVVKDLSLPLGKVIGQWRVHSHLPEDDVVHKDIILVWAGERRIITGSDILGRLLRGITLRGG